jgi:hypothetical protein
LQDFYANREDVYIASDMFWYWIEGDNGTRVAPDVMMIHGVPSHERRTFRSFDEGGAKPSIIFEMASQGTWKEDEEDKLRLYEELGVEEYYLFDPEWMYLSSPLKGYQLHNGAYRRLHPVEKRLTSKFGFQLAPEGTMLRLFWGTTGEPIPTREEAVEQAQARWKQAEAAASAAQVDARLAEGLLAEEQHKLAEEQRKLAEEQRKTAALLEEVARLKAQLQASGSTP